MFKKILLPLLLLATTQQFFPMESTISDNLSDLVLNNINNLRIYPSVLANILQNYTPESINHACKTIESHTNHQSQFIKDVLQGKKDINSCDSYSYSALHSACISSPLSIPTLVKLLEMGALLEYQLNHQKGDYSKHHCHFCKLSSNGLKYHSLYRDLVLHNRKAPFAIREALNNGLHIPDTAVISLLAIKSFLKPALLPEIAHIIKTFYIKAWPDLSLPEARIWKPVCIRACQLANINETDEDRCLTHIMTLPQRKKTEINLLLLEKGQ